jgi:hypothetical protein
MVLDYLIDIPCEPRRRLGLEALLARLRLLARARYSETLNPEEAAAARTAMFDLQPLMFHCGRCPANAAGHEFGCYGCLHEPVSIEAEEWLYDRLPLTLSEKRAEDDAERKQMERVRALAETLRVEQNTGDTVDERRGPGLAIRPKGMTRTYGSFFRRRSVGSSQLLELLLTRGVIDPATAELLCRALAVWQDGGIAADGLPEAVFTEPPADTDDQATADLKQLFLALMTACSLDVPVRTWLEPPHVSELGPAPAEAGEAPDPDTDEVMAAER